MTKEEVYEELCIYDKRNPTCSYMHEDDYEDEIQEPRIDCFCDNCFYGRDNPLNY